MVSKSKIRFLFSFPNCWGYFWIHNYTPNNVTFRAKKKSKRTSRFIRSCMYSMYSFLADLVIDY